MAQKIQTIITTVDDLDSSLDATTSRTFRVGTKSDRTVDLCDENAERFDSEFAEWTEGWKKRTFMVGKREYTRWMRAEDAERFDAMMSFWVKHSRREDDGAEDEVPSHRVQLSTIVPTPVAGQTWWMDPPRPFSRETLEAFKRARNMVRAWARNNGWPELGTRGMVPHAAYEKWLVEVWSTLDSPTWDAAEQASLSSRRDASVQPRRTTQKVNRTRN